MSTQLRPSDVFTPNRFPLGEHNVYVFRVDAERELRKATARGEVPVLYGEFGVGKTTLIKKFFEDADHQERLVHVLTPAGRTIGDIAKVVLERIGYTVQVMESTGGSIAREAALEAGFFGALKVTLKGKREVSHAASYEFVVKSPTEQRLLEVMADAQIVLAVDEMHKASEAFRAQLAEVIKAASNLGRDFPQIVVLGTATDAGKLVEHDPGVDRLLREIRVQPMTDEEASYVVTEGMQTLDLEISSTVVEHVVRTAAGAPALLQEICLEAAEHVVSRAGTSVELEDLIEAMKAFLLRSQERLTSTYVKAVETTGARRYRTCILRAMAECSGDYVTMDELTTRISRYLGAPVKASALSGPLRQLKEVEYGPDPDGRNSAGGRCARLQSQFFQRSPNEGIHQDAPRSSSRRTRSCRVRLARSRMTRRRSAPGRATHCFAERYRETLLQRDRSSSRKAAVVDVGRGQRPLVDGMAGEFASGPGP